MQRRVDGGLLLGSVIPSEEIRRIAQHAALLPAETGVRLRRAHACAPEIAERQSAALTHPAAHAGKNLPDDRILVFREQVDNFGHRRAVRGDLVLHQPQREQHGVRRRDSAPQLTPRVQSECGARAEDHH